MSQPAIAPPSKLSRREFFAAVATIACGLWLGGLVMLFMAVSSIFKTFDTDHATAGLAATGVFHRFENFQIVLAGVAIVALELSLRNGRRKFIIALPMIIAAVIAMGITFGITPRIDAMRLSGETATESFKKLHGLAMAAYLAITLLVAAATAILAVSLFAEIPPTVFGDSASLVEPADPAPTP
ncbi:hypothetical protein BH10PLA1_BH10PLA1_01340 [soil metagenome]